MAVLTQMEVRREALREQLRHLRSTPDDPVADKVRELITLLWKGEPDQAREEIAGLYRDAFGMDPRETDKRAVRRNAARAFRTLIGDAGWFGKYLEYTEPSEAPAQFHFGAALAFAGAGFGRAPLLGWEARETYCNQYVMLIGATGSRKGSAVEMARKVVVPALGTNVLPNEGTHQGFAEALRRRHAQIGESEGLIVVPELRVLLSRDDRNKQDIVTWLTDWWDSPAHWERALRGEEEYELYNVCVSILGATNLPWLKLLPSDAIIGGFLPRWLLLSQPESEKLWGKAMPQFNRVLFRELQEDLKKLAHTVPEHMAFDKTGEAWLEKWYRGVHKDRYEAVDDEQFRGWLDRKQPIMMKMAAVWQLVDGGPRDYVATEWLEKARQVVDWADDTVREVYAGLGTTREGEVAETVLGTIKRRSGPVPQRVILRALRNRYRAPRVREALDALVAEGTLRADVDPTAGKTYTLK